MISALVVPVCGYSTLSRLLSRSRRPSISTCAWCASSGLTDQLLHPDVGAHPAPGRLTQPAAAAVAEVLHLDAHGRPDPVGPAGVDRRDIAGERRVLARQRVQQRHELGGGGWADPRTDATQEREPAGAVRQ